MIATCLVLRVVLCFGLLFMGGVYKDRLVFSCGLVCFAWLLFSLAMMLGCF